MKITTSRCFKWFGIVVSVAAAACSDEQPDAVDVIDRIVVEGSACKVVYEVTGEWANGFTANVAVTNKQTAQQAWKLEWDFPSGQRVSSLWDGSVNQQAAHVSVTGPSWNSSLGSGATTRFGFNGSLGDKNVSPKTFSLNGVSCGESGDNPGDTTPGTGGSGAGGSGAGGSGAGGSGAGGSGAGGSGAGGDGGNGNQPGGCSAAPNFVPRKPYGAGERVQHSGKIYECREFPYSGWCGIGGSYAPGASNGADAWTLVGDCDSGDGSGNPGVGGNPNDDDPPGGDDPIGTPNGNLPKHALVGYWHNFTNPSGPAFPLSQVTDDWDVIVIAFAENDRANNGAIKFTPDSAINANQFKADVAAKRAAGKFVVLSLGGAEGTITLNTQADEDRFVSSALDILNTWGFDGLDIDLESGSGLVHGSQIQKRLVSAMRRIKQSIGSRFYLSMAPEHPYVQGGHIAYSGIWGAYLPIIDALRADLDILHVQLYNNGGLQTPYAGHSYAAGTTDMLVASVKMLVEGFATNGGPHFKGLRADQVAIGLPSGPASANSGLASIQTIIAASKCIAIGTNCASVKLQQAQPNFRGVMTWSINWDQHDGMRFSKEIGPFLDSL